MIELAGIFFLVSLSGALSPGPLTTLSITEGVRRGRWSGWWLSLGHAIVEAALVGAIAYGLGKWLTQPLVRAALGLMGGLSWPGWAGGFWLAPGGAN